MRLKEEEWHAALGRAIVRLRKRKAISQEKMALETGLARSHASKLEKGEMSPRFDTLLALVRFLNLTIDGFLREVRLEHGRLRRSRNRKNS